jgi:hypothetical protein
MFLSAIVAIYIFLLLPSYFFSLSKQNLSEGRLDAFNSSNKDLPNLDLSSTIVGINRKLDLLSSFKSGYSFYDDILATVLSNRIKGITFSQLLFNIRKDRSLVLEVHGEASDRETLRNFKIMVDKNPKVASTNLPMSNFLEKSNLNFTMSIVMK